MKVLQEMRPVTIDGKLTMSDFWLKTDKKANALRERKLTLPAMQHMFFEIERKYTHQAQFTPDKQTKLFDSDMVRVEYRDEQYTHKKTVYNNCLRVEQYVPPGEQTKGKGGLQTSKIYYYDHATNATLG